MHKDVCRLQDGPYFGADWRCQVVAASRHVCCPGGADESYYLPAPRLKGRADPRSEVARGACDNGCWWEGLHWGSSSVSDAIRCAFAMIVRVKVVAGTFGKTDASTTWTRCHGPTRPSRSLT